MSSLYSPIAPQSNYYDQVVQRYKDTIAAHFFGHSHSVNLTYICHLQLEWYWWSGRNGNRVLRLHPPNRRQCRQRLVHRSRIDSKKYIATTLFGKINQIGPLIGGNPAFKVYDVDPDTYEIMDSRVYISEYCVKLLNVFWEVQSSNYIGNMGDPSFQSDREFFLI